MEDTCCMTRAVDGSLLTATLALSSMNLVFSPQQMQQTATRLRQSMAGLGVHLRLDWVKHYLEAGGESGASGNGQRQQSEEQEGVYRTFLACDLREAGEACLPAGVGGMVKERVKGKMVVQVREGRSSSLSLQNQTWARLAK